METVELLRDTRALLSEPVRWTRGAYAKPHPDDDDDENFSPLDKTATCWCLVGAMSRVLKINYDEAGSVEIQRAAEVLGFDCVSGMVGWNDNPDTKYPDIVARLDTAIAKLEASNA